MKEQVIDPKIYIETKDISTSIEKGILTEVNKNNESLDDWWIENKAYFKSILQNSIIYDKKNKKQLWINDTFRLLNPRY